MAKGLGSRMIQKRNIPAADRQQPGWQEEQVLEMKREGGLGVSINWAHNHPGNHH